MTLSNNYFCGPNWYPYPPDFFLKKKKKKKFFYTLLISQGATDAHDNLKKLIKSIAYVDTKKITKCIIKTPKKLNLNSKHQNNIIVKQFVNIDKISNVLKNIDLAITGCGNLSFELSFFGIPCVFVSSEKNEIKRGKLLQKKGLGKFYSPNKIKDISIELNKLANNYNYYQNLMKKKLKIFKKDGLKNIIQLIEKHIHEI